MSVKKQAECRQSAKSLPENEEWFRSVFENSPVGIGIFDPSGQLITTNRSCLEILGAADAALLKGLSLFKDFNLPTPISDGLLKGESVGYEIPFDFESIKQKSLFPTFKSGSIYISVLITPLKDKKGNTTAFSAQVQDVTDRRRSLDNLAHSEARYRSLIDTAGAAICTADIDGNFSFVNHTFCELLDYSEAEVIGKNYKDLMHPSDVLYISQVFQEDNPCIRSESSRYLEFRMLRRDGEYIWFGSSPVPLIYYHEVVGYNAIMVDITDFKLTERKLISSLQREKYLADIIRETGVAICVGYMDGTIGIHNTAFQKLTGYSEEELKRISWDTGLTPPEWREIEKRNLALLDQAGREVRYQKEYIHKNGSRIPIELVVHPSFDDSGRISHYFAFITDITERKQIEAELIKSQGQFRNFSIYLQEKIEEERRWLSNEIHDELGQILTGLKIDLSWLSRKLPPETDLLNQKAKSMLELIDEADKVVKRITEDLRPVLLDDLGLIEAIGWLVTQFQNRTGITAQFTCTTGPVGINKGLAMDIFRIAQEALTNVSRHAEATRVRISFKKHARQFALSIKDNGKGVKSEDVADIKSFGLLGMQERAHRWKGTLKIHGIPGKGTTIQLNIPVEEEING